MDRTAGESQTAKGDNETLSALRYLVGEVSQSSQTKANRKKSPRGEQEARNAVSNCNNQPEIIDAAAHPRWMFPIIEAKSEDGVPHHRLCPVIPDVDTHVRSVRVERQV